MTHNEEKNPVSNRIPHEGTGLLVDTKVIFFSWQILLDNRRLSLRGGSFFSQIGYHIIRL
jgi:hypothetical protein